METDAIVVGCGLTGGIIARHLADHNLKVLILERRTHIAGNMYDYTDENGLLVQKYGPHVFHTVKRELFEYLKRFCNWYEFRVSCMTEIKGQFTPSPFNFSTIEKYYSLTEANLLKNKIKNVFGNADKATIVELLKCEDASIREYAEFLFAEDYGPYTAKQWGLSPDEVDISVLERVPVLFSYKTDYFDDPFQVMPENGFTNFFQKVIFHKNIKVRLNCDAKDIISIRDGKLQIEGSTAEIPVIYTGAVDELLDLKYGMLPYRSLRFDFRSETTDSYQEAPIVAYPKAVGYTRITEYSKMPPQNTDGTVIALEYPQSYQAGKTEPYYPILTESSKILYEKYRTELDKVKNLYVCGRLGDFKYYNMDQALERALEICKILDRRIGVD